MSSSIIVPAQAPQLSAGGGAWRSSRDRGEAAALPFATAPKVGLSQCDAAIAVASLVLLIGFVAPQVCTILQIILITAAILHGSPIWLPAILLLLFSPTDFKSGGMALQYEKFEGVTIYVLGFPLTASYAIVAAALCRGLLNLLGSSFARKAFSAAWVVPLCTSAGICIYISLLALDARVPGWSAPARATLLLFSLWYATSLSQDWALVRAVITERLGPVCCFVVLLAFFLPFGGPLGTFYLPMATAWSAWLSFGRPTNVSTSARILGWAAYVCCWLVPVVGLRVSGAVAEASFEKLGNQTYTTMTVSMILTASLLAYLQKRVAGSRQGVAATMIATLIFVIYVVSPFVVAAVSSDVDYGVKTNAGSFQERVIYKLFVERSAIWRGSIEVIKEPPYVVVPPGRAGSIITNSGRRLNFRHSSHNLSLDILRSQGWLAGGITICVIYACFLSCVRAYMTVSDPTSMLASVTFIVGVIVNGFGVGHFLDTGVELELLVCAGLCMGALVHARRWHASPAQSVTLERSFSGQY
jgi:hypothetical protein